MKGAKIGDKDVFEHPEYPKKRTFILDKMKVCLPFILQSGMSGM
jgi:hypothetical protein